MTRPNLCSAYRLKTALATPHLKAFCSVRYARWHRQHVTGRNATGTSSGSSDSTGRQFLREHPLQQPSAPVGPQPVMQRMCVATDFGKKQIFWPLPPRGRENLAMNSYSKSME